MAADTIVQSLLTDVRMAVDIGGTFTDIVLDRGTERLTRKVLTTAKRPEEGVLEGARLVLADAGLHFVDIDVFVHGTTLATNAIIERRGARTALIATEGFRDTLDIATESRYDQYDLTIEKPKPLIPRSLRFTVPERVDVHGTVRLALDEAAVTALVARLKANGIEAVAICFMHSYVNPAHEQRTGDIFKQAMPGLSVTLSSEVCPEIREYERTSTAVANAYVQRLMDGYLARMDEALRADQYRGAVYLVTSGGGLTSIDTARKFPVRLVESGPAGGAIFATQVAARGSEKKVLSFDMGGTTAKICLIENYEPNSARVYKVDRAARFLKGSGLPVRVPVIEMVEIGAGGGSIAHVDALERVTVGPESAGSEPGPACYRRGGMRPTVTDADVALGMIDPAAFAGGTISLNPDLSRAALATAIGDPLGMSPETAAYAVHEMVCENMASAARVHAVERGEVVSDHTLIAFGGAAPLHAARVAEKLGVPRVLVPPNAGVGSAVGFLAAPISYELVKSRHMRLDKFRCRWHIGVARRDVKGGARAGRAGRARRAGHRAAARLHALRRAGARDHSAAAGARSDPDDAKTLRDIFEKEYAVLFRRPIPGAAIEALSWSVLISTEAKHPEPLAPVADKCAPSPDGSRSFHDGRAGKTIDVPLYRPRAHGGRRTRERPGNHRRGRDVDIRHRQLRCTHRRRGLHRMERRA